MFFYNSDSDFLTAKEKNLYKVFKNSLDTEYKISFSLFGYQEKRIRNEEFLSRSNNS